jgi:hypothetical protein
MVVVVVAAAVRGVVDQCALHHVRTYLAHVHVGLRWDVRRRRALEGHGRSRCGPGSGETARAVSEGERERARGEQHAALPYATGIKPTTSSYGSVRTDNSRASGTNKRFSASLALEI